MKILNFSGGLGNQIFEYAFYLYIKDRFPSSAIYGNYAASALKGHNGLEIDKWFDAHLPPSTFVSRTIFGLCVFAQRIAQRLGGLKEFYDYSTRTLPSDSVIAMGAFRFTKEVFPPYEWLHFILDENRLSEDNKYWLIRIKSTNSCFIHIRRGDYLRADINKYYGGICTKQYYEQAIDIVEKITSSPFFFVFSDDINWVKENLRLDNAFFIDENHGKNSPIDMYLMSHCKSGIIANSTFSYFGAYLGVHKNVIVYPKQWINDEFGAPDIFFNDWIGI